MAESMNTYSPKTDPFNPNEHTHNLLEAFNNYISSYHYVYDSIGKDPPTSITEEEGKKTWIEIQKRKVFLGRHATRELQQEYEDCTQEEERERMTFTNMVKALQTRFKLSSNTTLANFKFRGLSQKTGETFNQFAIRIKHESQTCNFSCPSPTCNVAATLQRDQLLFGTHNDEIRRHALHEQWNLENVIKNGRSLEASTQGAEQIKPHTNMHRSREPEQEVLRTKPKKYSRKSQNFADLQKSTKRPPSNTSQCHTCSARECKGKNQCSAIKRKVTCFACRQTGHYKNSQACKYTKSSSEKKKTWRTKNDSESSVSTESEEPSSSSSYPPSSDTDQDEHDQASVKSHRARLRRLIPGVSRVKNVRKTAHKRKKHTPGNYEVEVVVNGIYAKAFADTGADICITSLKNARKMKLPLEKSKIKIKPYGSKSKACLGKYSGTIMHGTAVTNATIYVLRANVETLLSGRVCEQLGIIKFNRDPVENINNVELCDPDKDKLVENFPSVFKGVGVLKDHEVKFHIDETVKPVCQQARPIPFHLREKFLTELGRMEEAGIIEEHTGPTPWLSNIALSPKDDGDLRITVDMREPNKALMANHFPIMRPEEVKAQLASYKYFSKLDFKSAYHQLTLDQESRNLTVFHAGGKLMRYKRLPMGACPATGELAEALRPVFSGHADAHIIHDDVIIGGRTKEEHDINLYSACQTILEAGMTLNIKKCIIGKTEIPWWGLVITNKGIKPDPEKVKALRHATRPQDKEEVRSFLCMIQSNRDFIPNMAQHTTHLRNLTKKHTRFNWTKQCQDEFNKLCSSFKEDTLLKHYDANLPTFIFVDAHRTGVSAILAQGDTVESARPVAFASRATTPIEGRYPQLDLEALAIDFGMRRFRLHLVGAPEVTIITDHKPLEAIFRNKRQGSIRSERIKLRHQDIRYKVIWRDGKLNPADYLSRHATPVSKTPRDIQKESEELEKLVWLVNFGPYTEAVSMSKIIQHTAKDNTLKRLREATVKGYIPAKDKDLLSGYHKILDRITLSDEGLLLKDDKIIMPSSLTSKALEKAHQGGHPGMSCMKRRIRAHFWFPNMDTHIEEFVKGCKDCTIFTNKSTHGKLHHHWPKESWKEVNIDLFGPMPDSKHVLVVTDNMSRFPAAKIVPSTAAGPVLKELNNMYTDYGQPKSHRTDNGPPFNSKAFDEFSASTGIEHIRTFPYHPQANPAETFMKPLGKSMKIAHYNHRDKQLALNQLLSNYRATPHTATGIPPGDMLFRSGYRSGFPETRPVTDEQAEQGRQRDITQRSERTAKLNQSTHRKDDDLQIGDLVFTRYNNRSSKFQPQFDPTPRTITEKKKGGIICIDSNGVTQRRHLDDVKRATGTKNKPNSQTNDHVTSSPHFLITKNVPTNQDVTTLDIDQQTATTSQTPPTTEPADRPHRTTRPPTKYRSEAFSTILRPCK